MDCASHGLSNQRQAFAPASLQRCSCFSWRYCLSARAPLAGRADRLCIRRRLECNAWNTLARSDHFYDGGLSAPGIGDCPTRWCDAQRISSALSYLLKDPMNTTKNTSGAVPTSSGRNGFANYRMLVIGGVVVAFLAIAIFVPW